MLATLLPSVESNLLLKASACMSWCGGLGNTEANGARAPRQQRTDLVKAMHDNKLILNGQKHVSRLHTRHVRGGPIVNMKHARGNNIVVVVVQPHSERAVGANI